MKRITFIVKDTDGFTVTNGWSYLGTMMTTSKQVKIWKTLKGALKAVRNHNPNNFIVVTDKIPSKI